MLTKTPSSLQDPKLASTFAGVGLGIAVVGLGVAATAAVGLGVAAAAAVTTGSTNTS